MNNAHQCWWGENNKGAAISILTLNESACVGFTANALNVSIMNLWPGLEGPALLLHWKIYAAVLNINHILMWLTWQNINGAVKLKQSGGTRATRSSCLTAGISVCGHCSSSSDAIDWNREGKGQINANWYSSTFNGASSGHFQNKSRWNTISYKDPHVPATLHVNIRIVRCVQCHHLSTRCPQRSTFAWWVCSRFCYLL